MDLILLAAVLAAVALLAGFSFGQFLPFAFFNADDRENARLVVQLVLTAIGILASLYVILSPQYQPTERVAACGSLASIIGFWFGKKSK